jgi:hypothetical protein
MHSLLVFVLHENHKEPCENVNSVKVDPNTFIDRVINWLQFGAMNNFLNVIEYEGSKQEQTTIKVDIEQSLGRPEHVN